MSKPVIVVLVVYTLNPESILERIEPSARLRIRSHDESGTWVRAARTPFSHHEQDSDHQGGHWSGAQAEIHLSSRRDTISSIPPLRRRKAYP
jgi:hypothetical protein